MATPTAELITEHPTAEIQTDKVDGKVVPCIHCSKDLIVSTFYAPANAKCASCKGSNNGQNGAPKVTGVVKPGETDPRTVRELRDVLLHPEFEDVFCPICKDLKMELKSVCHNPRYGPSVKVGFQGGKPIYKQIEAGETTMAQCNHCKTTVSFSTTAQHVFKRINEKLQGSKHVNRWANEDDCGVGVRDEVES